MLPFGYVDHIDRLGRFHRVRSLAGLDRFHCVDRCIGKIGKMPISTLLRELITILRGTNR